VAACETSLVTAPKPTSRKAVDRVFHSLATALRPELDDATLAGGSWADMDDELLGATPSRPTTTPRGIVLWNALRLAAAARARFVRREQFRRTSRRGDELATLDDTRKDRAMVRLRDAARLTGEARQALEDDIAAVQAMNKRYGGILGQDEETELALKEAQRLEQGLNALLERLNMFKGVPQIRTQREWDRFLSETASAMLDLGFSPREVAGILTGTAPAKVTTQTLERFRQRVRRLKETEA